MKIIKSTILKSFKVLITFTIVCGILYTSIVTIVAQGLFNNKANGSIIERNGQKYGSELIAQPTTSDKLMWGRAINPDFKSFESSENSPLYYAKPTNLSPTSEKFEKMVKERADEIVKINKKYKIEKPDKDIPQDLVTVSGSGLDPDISYNAAIYQAKRIAKANGISEDKVVKLIDKSSNGKFLGVFGERTVNVLKFNLEIDKVK